MNGGGEGDGDDSDPARGDAGVGVPAAPDDLPQAPVPLGLPPLSATVTAAESWMHFSAAPMDSSGRIQDRRVVAILGWSCGDHLTITVIGSSVVVQRHAEGVFRMTATPYVALPAPVRSRCRLSAGTRVMLVADPGQDALVVHPPAGPDC
jgi:hypothetical protein